MSATAPLGPCSWVLLGQGMRTGSLENALRPFRPGSQLLALASFTLQDCHCLPPPPPQETGRAGGFPSALD